MRSSSVVAASWLLCCAFGRTVVRTAGEQAAASRLAVFVRDLARTSSDSAAVAARLEELVTAYLEVEQAILSSPLRDPEINSGSVFTFTLWNDGQVVVDTSDSTPDAFNGYAAKWKGALEYNPDVSQPLIVEDEAGGEPREYNLDTARYAFAATQDDEIAVTDKYEEGLLAELSDDVATDVANALATRYQFMQLKLTGGADELLAVDPEGFVNVLDGLRTSAAAVLAVPVARVVLASVEDDSVLQFSVYPATLAETQKYADAWTEAIKGKAAEIAEVFGDTVDYSYPPVVLTGATTTTPTPPSVDDDGGTSAGVVAGAVAGSLAGAGAVGALGIAYKRRRGDAVDGARPPKVEPDFDSVSPPNGLTNVDIRGDITPNNYRA